MNRTPALLLAFLSCALLSCESPPEEGDEFSDDFSALEAEASPVGVERDPDVDAVVLSMAEALRAAKSLSFRIESWTDEEGADGNHVSVPASSTVLLRHPDRLLVDRVGEKGHRVARYDGASFSLCDPDRNVWARIAAPATLEETFDLLHDRYGLVVPLADLFVGDPHAAYTEKADRAEYLGVRPVRGVPCHHVSLSNDALAWQIWVPAEGPALPRRVEIRYLDEEGTPRFLADLDEWAVDPPAADDAFAFTPPEGSREIEILPRDAGESDAEESR